jgi:RHS repeat-associated protein
MRTHFLYRTLLLIGLLCTAAFAFAGDGGGIVARAVLDGSKHQLQKDSSGTVEDSAFFNASGMNVDTGYSVQNVITLKINESSPLYLRTAFTATVKLVIAYSNGSDTASIIKDFTINYDSARNYNARNSFMFYGGRRVTVKVLSVTTNVSWDAASVLLVENQLTARPKYIFSCTNTVTNITVGSSTGDELPVNWTAVRGADQYDVEWTYIDASALGSGRYNNASGPDAAKIFYHNATRISTSGNTYNIPLIYDNNGTLFIRVRPVQIGDANAVTAANWSSVMGQYQFTGHERKLNWQSNVTFAEEGKRKVEVQYFDGGLRNRQTVTKDNTTNNTIVAETFYDYQGRPAIQVMPAPSIKNVIQYTAGFNVSINHPEYSQGDFDTLYSPDLYCSAHAAGMTDTSGASLYYSANNPKKKIGMNQFIPDAQKYPFSETEYTQDNTGRISRQGGAGPDFQLGSGHETKYFYGTPDQNELDALFGTDVGDRSHYFKNMVRDANGQYSVSYVDMHGRTIATALAGNAPAGMAALPSNVKTMITENLADSGSRFLQDWSMVNQKSLVVPMADTFTFNYRLDPDAYSEKGCEQQNICYTCLYDLQITITDNCNNQLLPGGRAFDTVIHNFSFGAIPNTCSPSAMNLGFSLYLKEGSYQVTKQLSINRDAYVYYRDSVYLPNNTCKSMDDFITEQRSIIALSSTECIPDCKTCRDSVGTYEHFKNNFISKAGIPAADVSLYTTQIDIAYNNAIAACKELCGDSTSVDNDIRLAMLQDMTPPYGQYADVVKGLYDDKYSVFYVNPDDTLNYVPVYRLDGVQYKDENGQVDKIYNLESELMVDPATLTWNDFAQSFRTSWSEALLPYHPEYCKLLALEALKPSNVWDRQMESMDNFRDARAAGYLNPTGGNYPYPKVDANIDPFSRQSSDTKSKLEAKLTEYMRLSNGPTLSMWGMACVMAKCGSGNAACLTYYASSSNAFDTLNMCEGDLDMAWRSFRQLYLTAKQELVNYKVNHPEGCKPLNPAYTDLPTYEKLVTDHHRPQFSEDTKTTGSKNGLDYVLQGGNGSSQAGEAANQAQGELSKFYDDNCTAMMQQWAADLSPCSYTDEALRDTLLPMLRGLCRMACDKDHPFGASTLPAGKNYNGYTSFKKIIDDYNSSHNINDPLRCNAELITTPAPYDKQPVYYNKPVYTKPADCECTLLNDLFNKYRNLQTDKDISFAAYIERTQGVTMSDSDLRTLRELCNNTQHIGPDGEVCVYLSEPIYLPPALQCNSGESCTSCTVVSNLYQSYQQEYPLDTPRIADVDDTVQTKRNNLFRNYMNNRLGYSLQAWEYLQFMKECADSVENISNTTVCVDEHIGNLFLSDKPGRLEDIQATPDGGYIMAGHAGLTLQNVPVRDGVIMKSNAQGGIQWSRKYGGAGDDYFTRIKRTSDNGYVAIGTTKSAHYGKGAIWIVKTDASGEVSWTKTIGFGTPNGERGYDIIQTTDGGYAALGIYNQHTGHGEFLLTNLSSTGAINWVHRFGTSRLQNNSFDCITPGADSLSYDGAPSYGLLQHNDTLLVTGAAYDRNLGDRYYGVVYRVNKNDGNLLGYWHYADNDPNTSCWLRDIHATPTGYMIMAGNAQKLSTTNAQVSVINITTTGDVQSYQRFNLPAGSSKMVASATFPTSDGGYIVAQKGNANSHIIWQRVNATGSVLWVTETAFPGTQSVGRIIQRNDTTFAIAGDNNQQMMMLVLHPGNACYDNTIELGTTTPSLARINWAIESSQYVTPAYTDMSLSPMPFVITKDSVIRCPGTGTCYNNYEGPRLCGKSQPLLPTLPIDYTGVCTDSTFFAVSKGTELSKVYSDSLTGAFEQNYINKCLQAYRHESFTVTHPKREYHYTLYYYDQAGNLIRTVPPAGVHPISDTNVLKQVKAAREARTELLPQHTLATDSRFNTLDQMVTQHTPDGGTNSFWYDRLGRLCISQNAKQKDSGQYSYTKYDSIGRIIEVGQLASGTTITDQVTRSQPSLAEWLTNAGATTEQITKTNYDYDYSPIQPVLKASNLRGRVSFTALFNTATDLANNNAATATYYSYDVLGNIDTLLQDYKLGVMAVNGNRFKKVVFNFDQVSGKVNQMSYQPGERDAFYHHYVYDAENRITHVLTSADSINWDNDAFYTYYDHGPLARVVLGEQQVQGVNYAFNLNGWIKSINPDIYNATGYSLKADGTPGSIVGKPAYNLMLNYFNGDYKAISSAAAQDALLNDTLGSDYRPLYNGNISSMAVNIAKLNNPLLYNYQYDQLSRLVTMDAWNKTGNNWSNIKQLTDFQERVSYDPNGNILKYKRNGNYTFAGKQLGMDSLNYNYVMGTNQLDHVSDSVASGNYDVDIDSQKSGNYKYDAIGNLIKDSAENIASISWTVYGKVSRVVKSDGTNIYYTYDAGGNRISKVVVKASSALADTTWYVRDAKGNVLSVYSSGIDSINNGHLSQTELHVYGSSRLGIVRTGINVDTLPVPNDTPMPLLNKGFTFSFARGNKLFELSNHLGNVLVTVNDKKVGISSNDSTVDYFNPQVVSAQDYYPFGMMQPERKYNVSGYRYGFNGKENDNEISGEGNNLDFGSRIYDPRLGKWLSLDAVKVAWQSPYVFVSNSPVQKLDPDGNWQTDGHYWTVYLVALLLDIPDAQTLAYYTEYPDTKIHGYVAAERYTWAVPKKQQHTHALTGGWGPDLSVKTTRDILNADFKNMEELGRLIHKLGDTYAHRVLGGKGNLYGNNTFTLDHLWSDGSKPDLIMNRMDDGMYESYVHNLTAVLSTKYQKFDAKKLQNAREVLIGLGEYARKNKVSLIGIINYEVAAAKGENKFFIHKTSSLLTQSKEDYDKYVKSTSEYLTKKGVKFTTREVYETVTYEETYNDGNPPEKKTTQVFRGTEFTIQKK